ncbi:MAG: HD-GYP domain-containing protein [Phycisphaerales bacterium JB040]
MGTNGQSGLGEALGGERVALSEVVGALSYALDITEGQPEGHAVRACMIGMRLGEEIGLSESRRSALFYALLLKDLGCSSNAAKICYLFGADDQRVKHGFKFTDWQSVLKSLPYIIKSVAPSGSPLERLRRFLSVAVSGTKGAKELIKIRCERGALIARDLDLPEEAVQAIRNLDEHWNGRGHPDGLRGEEIPLLARILSVSQTAEVFLTRYGLAAALQIVRARRTSWFDPDLVRAFESIAEDTPFWMDVMSGQERRHVARFEPRGMALHADEATIDRLCGAFSQVVDAKSPWTACHSQGVSDVAVGIGRVMGLGARELTGLRRAGLLHDIGKLGVSNAVLDKPGRLTEAEFARLREHPAHTHRILSRAACFEPIAELAARHHEKLDGSGYHRGLRGAELSLPERVLVVADMYEALAAKRPYRQDLSEGEVMDILGREAGVRIDAGCVEALGVFLERTGFEPYRVAA